MKTADYITKIKETVPEIEFQTLFVDDGGFRYEWSDNGRGNIYHSMLVPKSKMKKASFAVRLSIKHEIGHLILMHIINISSFEAKLALHKIPKWFRFIQKFWYWNKTLRKIRIKMGFSNELNYDPGELSYNICRSEHELFADWSAFGRWRGYKDR